MPTIELHFRFEGKRIRYGVMKDSLIPVYNGFVELETHGVVYHFRAKMAFPVYNHYFGAVADAIGLALEEAKALAKELLALPDPLERLDVLDRGVFIYKFFSPGRQGLNPGLRLGE